MISAVECSERNSGPGLTGKSWQSAASGCLQQGIAGAAGIIAALTINGWRTCHGRADGVRMWRHAKAHSLLKAGGRVHVAAVGAAVLGVDVVVDASAGFLGALRGTEMPDRVCPGLGRALFQAALVDGGGAAGQEERGGQCGD